MAEGLLIAVIVGGLWFAGSKTVSGVKTVNHKIAAKFHHHKKPPVDTPPANK